jgi:hypothetical protein
MLGQEGLTLLLWKVLTSNPVPDNLGQICVDNLVIACDTTDNQILS